MTASPSSASSPGLAERPQKRCEWNRYCAFIGPFCSERLLAVRATMPLVVGRCYVCGGYVCSRCAGRAAPPAAAGGSGPAGARQLVCPRDGAPLGRGDDWVAFRDGLDTAILSRGCPDPAALLTLVARPGALRLESPAAQAAHARLGEACEKAARGEIAAAIEDCTVALAEDPSRVLALVLRRSLLERLGRAAEAWRDLRALFAAEPAALADALAELGALAAGELAGEYSAEIARLMALESVVLPAEWRKRLGAVRSARSVSPVAAPRRPAPLPARIPAVHSAALSLANPSHTTRLTESCPAEATRALVVLAHEPGEVEQQKNVYHQLEHVLASAPDVPVLLEGFSGARTDESLAVKNREARLAQAMALIGNEKRTAAEAFRALAPRGSPLLGADDRALLQQQETEQRAVLAGLGQLFAAESMLLELAAQGLEELAPKVRGAGVARLLELRQQVEQTQKVTAYLQKLAPMARQAGLPLDRFPFVAALVRASELERRLDFNEVERQRMSLIQQLAAYLDAPPSPQRSARLGDWCAAESAEEAELDARYPELLKMAGIEPRKPRPRPGLLGRMFGSAPAAPPAPELYWFGKLLLLSKAYQDRIVSQRYYYLRLRGLLEALGCPVPPELAGYIEYVLLAEEVDLGQLTTVELPAFERELRCALAATAAEYGVHSLAREFRLLNRLLLFRLPAEEVPPGAEHASILRWAADAIRLSAYLAGGAAAEGVFAGQSLAAFFDFVPRWEAAVPRALAYYDAAAERSRRLVAASLAGRFAPAPVRVLVCGRFHLAAVAAEAERVQVSVVVLAPFPEPAGGRGPVSRARWASADWYDAGGALR
jgi:hypothetical protein